MVAAFFSGLMTVITVLKKLKRGIKAFPAGGFFFL
jgi:hypothetical protein